MLTFDEKLQLLRISSFLGRAPLALLFDVAAAAYEQSFDKGQFIYAKNDPAGDFYLLVQGRIGHPEVQAGNEELALASRADTPGQLFGFAAAVQGQPLRVISARCELPTTVLAVDGRWFQELCRRYGREGEERLRELVRAHADYERTILGRPGWVSVRNAGKKYGSGANASVALDDCSFEVRPGEFSAVMGPHGCGKSTLARAIAGLEALNDGVIYLDGEVVNRPDSKPNRGRVHLHQRDRLLPRKTILENLTRRLKPAKAGDNEALHRTAQELLERFGLGNFAHCRVRGVPAWVRRRAEIVAACLRDVDVIVFDEPFLNVPELDRAEFHRLLLELHQSAPKTVLFMTEDVEESLYIADRVQVMTMGRIRQSILIDLPRLGRPELMGTHEFLRVRQNLMEALHAPAEITAREMPEPSRRLRDDTEEAAAELLVPARERAPPPANTIREALHGSKFFWTIEFIPSVDKILRDELHKLGGIAEVLADDQLLAGFAV
ncbi:MAG: ATP-binding cassette domain-containing protein, partial [Burkholderiales bacterium]